MSLNFADVVLKLTNEYKLSIEKARKMKSRLKMKNARILSLESEIRNVNYTLALYISKFGDLKEDDDDETKSDGDVFTRASSQTL